MPSSASKMRRRTVARTCILKRQERRLCRVAPSRTVLSVSSGLLATFVVPHSPGPVLSRMGRLELGPWPSSRVTGMSVESTKINIPPNMKHVMADAQKDLGKNNLENLEPRKQCRRGRCKREENSLTVSLVNAKRWGAGSAAGDDAPPRAAVPKIRRGYFGRGPRTNVPDRRSLVTAPRSPRAPCPCAMFPSYSQSHKPLPDTAAPPPAARGPRCRLQPAIDGSRPASRPHATSVSDLHTNAVLTELRSLRPLEALPLCTGTRAPCLTTCAAPSPAPICPTAQSLRPRRVPAPFSALRESP